MNKVITISLNGNAYQVEEGGHDALSAYLAEARARLADNPDREEIVRDLEQAVADKLGRFLNAHKAVVTSAEVAEALKEMGPVDSSAGSGQTAEEVTRGEQGRTKHLYRIPQGARLAGVASGLGAYFNIDVTLVRAAFILLTILTGGGWIVAYIAFAIIIPRADTPEQVSRAYGAPFNAQEVMSRAHAGYEDIRKNAHAWRDEHRAWRKQWKAEMHKQKWQARHVYGYHHRCHGGVFGFIFQCLFLALVVWAIYHYIPSTQPFWHHVGSWIQTAWAWLNAKVVH